MRTPLILAVTLALGWAASPGWAAPPPDPGAADATEAAAPPPDPGAADATGRGAEDGGPAAPAPAAGLREVERRLAELEGRLFGAGPGGGSLPSRSGWGGVVVGPGDEMRDVVGIAGPVRVQGVVRGNAVGLGADVCVTEGGRVDGHAVALGGDVRIEEGGTVHGERLSLRLVDGVRSVLALPVGADLAGFGHALARRLSLLLLFAAGGTVAVAVWPLHVDEVARRLSDRPFWYGMVGAVLNLALATAAVALSLTLVGLPLALLFIVVLALAWLVGMASLCRAAGERLLGGRQHAEAGAFLFGALLLGAACLVPVIGTPLVLLLGLPAMGAAVVSGLSMERHKREW